MLQRGRSIGERNIGGCRNLAGFGQEATTPYATTLSGTSNTCLIKYSGHDPSQTELGAQSPTSAKDQRISRFYKKNVTSIWKLNKASCGRLGCQNDDLLLRFIVMFDRCFY